ncbi:MAG: gliding motility-associated C-terminal domain-containing protein [Saprospiraceae bacterium]|nr:gliding motility-associated C-terminal domain-containing protein [Saprospiraceae bacterium]
MTIRSIALALLFFHSTAVSGQVDPPVFNCLKGDTLTWSLPTVSCGAFAALEVYYSSTETGPFGLIETVTDPTVVEFVHDVPGDRFYYLVAQYGCPMPMSPPSDTVGSPQLQEVRIERLNVNADGSVNIRWYPHPSQTIVGYVIEKTLLDQGITEILDTVMGSNEYIDTDSEADLHPEYYRVWGFDLCGNDTQYPSNPHTTIHLRDSADFCRKTIELYWDLYTGWDNPVRINDVYIGENGTVPDPEHNVRGDTDFLGIINVSSEIEYCIYVVAHESNTGVTARSNTICVRPDVLSPITLLTLDNISVDGAAVALDWSYNTNADLNELDIERSDDDGATFQVIQSYADMYPSTQDNVEFDPTAMVNQQSHQYQITLVDQCDTTVRSAVGSSMHLQVSTNEQNNNTLNWTPFDLSGRELVSYSLCKITNMGTGEVTDLPIDQLQFVEAVDPMQASLEVCYLTKAIHTNASGTDTLTALSNQACLEQKVEAYLPNAFAPSGTNREFRPEFIFAGGISAYRMLVFNRWGVQLFESNDPNQGWDGRVKGELMPTGVYTYVIEIEQAGAEKRVQGGTVTLIR